MRRPLLVMGSLFLLGETAFRLLDEYPFYSAVISVLFLIILIICNRFIVMGNRCLNLLLFLCFILGGIWSYGYYYSGPGTSAAILNESADTEVKIKLKGIILSIKTSETSTRLVCKREGSSEKILCLVETDSLGVSLEEAQGRQVEIIGTVERLSNATNPGEMDMEQYYLGQGIRYQIRCESVEMRKGGNYLLIFLGKMRENAARILDKCYTSENAAILKTLLLGDKSAMDRDTKLLYQRAGIAHILAISGLHIALIAGILEWLLIRAGIRKNISSVMEIVFLILYSVMTGMSQATMRAVIMLIIIKSAYILKRTPDLPTSMMEALLVMMILNPDCIFSTGMLMSFAAILGIWTGNVFYDSIFERERFHEFPKHMRNVIKKLLGTIIMSFSINLWMIPLIIFSYFEVPVFAMLLSLIVTALLSIVIVLGFLVILLGAVAGSAGGYLLETVIRFFVNISSGILRLYEMLCRIVVRWRFSVIITGHISAFGIILYYLILTGLLYLLYMIFKGKAKYKKQKNKEQKNKEQKNKEQINKVQKLLIYIIFSVTVSAELLAGIYISNYTKSELVFLDVGQGDGAIIRTTGRKNYIMDAGSSNRSEIGRYTLIPALKYYGISEIETIFISHMDSDHMNGILYLLQNKDMYGIRVKYVAVAKETSDSDNYTAIRKEVVRSVEKNPDNLTDQYADKSEGTKLIELEKDMVVDGRFRVLYPDIDGLPENLEVERTGNDYSLVMDFTDKDLEVLFTGDISQDVERYLLSDIKGLNRGEKRILKCPHHGSKYSSSWDFLESYSPDMTVISCARKNRYGHPSPETLERLKKQNIRIFRTDMEGAVVIKY